MLIPKDKIESESGKKCWINAILYGKTKKEVSIKKKKYFANYDPRGYDTHIANTIRIHRLGYWLVCIRRYSTCD